MPSSKKEPGSARRLMRSRAVKRPLACWLSMALAPPPSRIFSSWLCTCDTRSAMKRMLASKRAEVGSTLEGSRSVLEGEALASIRSAMSPLPQTLYGIPRGQGRATRQDSNQKKVNHRGHRGTRGKTILTHCEFDRCEDSLALSTE